MRTIISLQLAVPANDTRDWQEKKGLALTDKKMLPFEAAVPTYARLDISIITC